MILFWNVAWTFYRFWVFPITCKIPIFIFAEQPNFFWFFKYAINATDENISFENLLQLICMLWGASVLANWAVVFIILHHNQENLICHRVKVLQDEISKKL